MGEDFGEASLRPLPGEGHRYPGPAPSSTDEIREKILTFEEASRALNTLGKDESGARYAYLMITATDRKLTDVSIILNFKHVLFIDVSGNYLTLEALKVLAKMPFLVLLKAERNRVESAALDSMYYLQVLDLNQNQIKETGSINQPFLECLEMNFNDIYTTQFENSVLDNLKQLELRSNLLYDISGVYPEKIEKLYIPANKISSINTETLSELKYLKILHLRENNLQTLDGFSSDLVSLQYLNLRSNKIKRYIEFKKLESLPKLEVLVVTDNPLPGTEQEVKGEDAGESGAGREPALLPLLVILPKLKRVNKTVVTAQDRMDAEDMQEQIWENILSDIKNNIDSDRDATTTDLTATDYKTETESDV